MTKADNVSFDDESSDNKDSFVVVVDSLAVCDRVFRVVLERSREVNRIQLDLQAKLL